MSEQVAKDMGVSWSFLLRNAYVMVRLRRTPLQGLVGSVRLSAECLWTYGAHVALDGVREMLETMWGEAGRGSFSRLRWQLSQLHLCADVANFAPEPADLDRFVTRARKKAIYVPSVVEVSSAYSLESATTDNLLDLVGELRRPRSGKTFHTPSLRRTSPGMSSNTLQTRAIWRTTTMTMSKPRL